MGKPKNVHKPKKPGLRLTAVLLALAAGGVLTAKITLKQGADDAVMKFGRELLDEGAQAGAEVGLERLADGLVTSPEERFLQESIKVSVRSVQDGPTGAWRLTGTGVHGSIVGEPEPGSRLRIGSIEACDFPLFQGPKPEVLDIRAGGTWVGLRGGERVSGGSWTKSRSAPDVVALRLEGSECTLSVQSRNGFLYAGLMKRTLIATPD